LRGDESEMFDYFCLRTLLYVGRLACLRLGIFRCFMEHGLWIRNHFLVNASFYL